MNKLITENLSSELKKAKAKTPEERVKALRKKAFSTPTPVQMVYIPFDPVSAYKMTGIPSNMDDDEERDKIFEWCRFWTAKHHLIPTLIEIFAKFPIIGITHSCKDTEISDYFNNYFDNVGMLDYIVTLGNEYWSMGNVVSSGQWSEDLKCWVGEDIIPIENTVVKLSPITKTRKIYLKVTDQMTELYDDNGEDGEEFRRELEELMPNIIPFIQQKKDIPLDMDCTNHLKIGGDLDWRTYGEPHLTRIFSKLEAEAKLDRAHKAVADRLYSPLILAKVGAPASSMGGADAEPWIPDDTDLGAVQATIENALMSDTRLIVTHFGLDIEAVDLVGNSMGSKVTEDYSRIEAAIYQAFGINSDIISGGSTTYASTAVSADFLIQRFISYQTVIKNWLMGRYRRVAEENGFVITDAKGNAEKEKVLVQHFDEDTGKITTEVEERDKLMLPEIVMSNMDMRTDETQKDFVMSLRDNGIPISDKYLIGFSRGQDIDFETEMKQTTEEEVQKAVYKATKKKLIKEKLEELGLSEYYEETENINVSGQTNLSLTKGQSPKDSTEGNGDIKNVPEESNEQKKTMPKAPTKDEGKSQEPGAEEEENE